MKRLLWIHLLKRITPNFHWRLTCPDTVDSIAVDFVERRLPKLDSLRDLDFGNITRCGDPWFAWRRRICFLYGVSNHYHNPSDPVVLRGWNHRLWRNEPGYEPEALVDRIFDEMIQRLQLKLEDVSG
ncbi:hypothetical protein NG895_14685 [Aeoliella sp. ICT_H6.2]|uniref:Uncharacterized protein n=1 Tax=Aeoliella straminimaris TaxID=2954799 RepID=A0A9X2FA11_9BACT|nr:hypothetical protein [Aeoliella straminimaris]MCO6045155.1 hypothetical protein [Aeoliella straminimaris]